MSAKIVGYIMYAIALYGLVEVVTTGYWFNLTYVIFFIWIGFLLNRISEIEEMKENRNKKKDDKKKHLPEH